MKLTMIVFFLAIMAYFAGLGAQTDSTFVQHYYPTSVTHPAWAAFPISETFAANVLETYDGDFVLQSVGVFHTPPPEWITPQSQMILYSRNGEYQNTLFGPVDDEGNLLVGQYSRIIKDGFGGYLALDSCDHGLHRLDSDFRFVEWVSLNGVEGHIGIRDILPTEDGFVVFGHVSGVRARVMKFSNSCDLMWQYPIQIHSSPAITTTSDGGLLFNWWYSPLMRLMKVSAEGDSLWTIEYSVGNYKESIVEVNDVYYGIRYSNGTIEDGLLQVYSYRQNFSILNPEIPIFSVPTYGLLDDECVFPVIRTSDGCLVMAVSTPSGEVFKFDSNFNLLWSSNALSLDRIGIGKHPLIELDNGDILYCATVHEQPQHLALVRIDSNGNYVGNMDYTEPIPPAYRISAYPNPFSSEITIKTERLPVTDSKLLIYNIRGQLVDTIELRDNTVNWTPGNMPSGIYILNLVCDGDILARKRISFIK